MIVIVIVGISAALLAPAMTRSMAINRVNRCQYDAARMFRAARANAIGTGRAHLVNVTNTPGDFRLDVYMGDSSSCARSQWSGANAIVDPLTTPVDHLYETEYTTPGHGVRLAFQAPVGGGARPQQICFEPQGDRYHRPGTVGVFTRGGATLTFTIVRLENGADSGDPERRIILPQYGTPRVHR